MVSLVQLMLWRGWTAIDGWSIIWKIDLFNKLKQNFIQVVVVSILQYGCTACMLTKCIEKKLDGNCTRMLWAILNKSCSKQLLYGYIPPFTKTIQIRWIRHAGRCWGSKDKIISDVLLWAPLHGRTNISWPTRTYLQQLCGDTGCCLEDLPGTMDDRDELRKKVIKICAVSATWWWWWWWWRSYYLY